MRVNVIAEPPELDYSDSVVTTSTFMELEPGSCYLGVCLHNLSSRKVKIPAHIMVGQVQVANRIPNKLALKAKEEGEEEDSKEPDYSIVDKIDMSGCSTWT